MQGDMEQLRPYYIQGTGGGRTPDQADRYARISLVGYLNGIDVQSITQDRVRVDESNGDEVIVRVTTQKGEETIQGRVPPGAYIADRWKASNDLWWSLILYEREGSRRTIDRLRNQRLAVAQKRIFVPGWSQITKGQKRKGWRIIGIETASVIGWWGTRVLKIDYERKRRRSKASTYQYYTDRANAMHWASAGLGTVAVCTYLYNVIDGVIDIPPTYKLLLSRVDIGVQPSSQNGLVTVAYKF
jgi:hypothetical protein